MEKLITHPYYNPDETAEYFDKRCWPVVLVPRSSVELVQTEKGAALECADGRFDNCPNRKFYGPRIFGGVNVVAAMITGGDSAGFIRAARLVEGMGYSPGTHSAEHGGCGYYDLWADGSLTSALYPLDKASFSRIHIKNLMELAGGKHFKLNGEHVEEAVRLNPYFGTTEKAEDCKRFRVDDWFLAYLGVPAERRYAKIMESVEKLKPDAARCEIIVEA